MRSEKLVSFLSDYTEYSMWLSHDSGCSMIRATIPYTKRKAVYQPSMHVACIILHIFIILHERVCVHFFNIGNCIL